jgi:hypothetical protein
MARLISGRRRWPAAIVIAVSALAIGAVLATPREGRATRATAPVNIGTPTISGTPQELQTLSADHGTWSNSPTSYAYAWSRCDKNGGTCAAIAGATSATYPLVQADVGSTLRATVTATNAGGPTTATTVPTAVIAAAPAPTGCPSSGTGVIQVGDVSAPARLTIDQQTITPGVVTPTAQTIQAHFRVTACGGRPVQGALVYVTAVPYNQYSVPPEGTTGADGSVTLTMTQLRGFPAARQQQLLVLFARARKPGDPVTGGISTRLLVSFPVSLR